jgi:hypothetical protein
MRIPEHKHTPLWKKSMVDGFSLSQMKDFLYEIMDNGDMYGYEHGDECGYYLEYKEFFDEVAFGASELYEALDSYDMSHNWDDMTVALLGQTHKVLVYDIVREDYFDMLNRWDEVYATNTAVRRIEKFTKKELITCFRQILTTLILFLDIKSAHDSLCAIVEELDDRGSILKRMMDEVNKRYANINETFDTEYDKLIASLPQRAWVE